MPQYTFYCKPCNLQFTKRLRMDSNQEYKCPSCKKMAPRKVQGFGFDFAPTEGTARANSGVSKHDYPTADNIVGRSAEERWQALDARNRAKKQLRDQTGAVALSRRDFTENGTPVTEYTSLGTPQFEARKKLEGRFRQTAEKVGLEQPSSNMPKKPAAS